MKVTNIFRIEKVKVPKTVAHRKVSNLKIFQSQISYLD